MHRFRVIPAHRIVLATVTVAAVFAFAPGGLAAQVGIAVLREPGKAENLSIPDRLARPLTWRQIMAVLVEAGFTVPPSPPPGSFSLTPRAPYRMPGGFLYSKQGSKWDPSYPNPTGGVSMNPGRYPQVMLSGLKPGTHYVLDVSYFVYGSAPMVTVRGCTGSFRVQVSTSGVGHFLVVVPTSARGDGCVSLEPNSSGIRLHRVDVTELGPVR